VEHLNSRWLDVAFFGSALAVVGLVGVAIAREAKRPPVLEQRIVTALDVVDRCEGCHDLAKHPGAWTASHPVERFGCTPCHGGQGLATNANDAHGEHLDWERPLFSKGEREANCGTCHQGDEVDGAPVLNAGRRALAERGCAGCHEIAGLDAPKIAPELDGLRDKLTPGWVRAWLTDPAKLNVAHKMPRFDLAPDQIESLTTFLFSLPGAALPAMPADVRGDSDRGKIAVAERRCATCHFIEGRGGAFGTSLDNAGSKISAGWMFGYLSDTHRVHPRTQMPGFRLPAAEAADIVAYATEQWVPDTADTPWKKLEGPLRPGLEAEGRKLFTELGCRGCHAVTGIDFVRVGMPILGVADRQRTDLPTARGAAREGDVPSWVAHKILAPRVFDLPNAPVSRMPTYRLDEAEARAIGVAVAALRTSKRPAAYLRVPEGAASKLPGGATGALVERFRCLVCHRIGGQGGDVSRVPLDGEGSRVQRAWLERFLRQPVTVRMDQAERMPVLGIDEASAARLASWIEVSLNDPRIGLDAPTAADDRARGKQLYEGRGCPTCHFADGQGTMMKAPALDGAAERLQFGYVVAMLRRGSEVVPARRHPVATYPLDEARAIAAYVCSLASPQAPSLPK
jgi:mono/diheme cytochrome c family protein